jgi:hypothetical protein
MRDFFGEGRNALGATDKANAHPVTRSFSFVSGVPLAQKVAAGLARRTGSVKLSCFIENIDDFVDDGAYAR